MSTVNEAYKIIIILKKCADSPAVFLGIGAFHSAQHVEGGS